jgi:short-subunit dehydrogenase
MPLKNKRILLTGAAGGIGQELVQRLAQEGAHLMLVDRNTDALTPLLNELDPRGERLHTLQADLLEPDAPKRVADAALARFDVLDLLINNAGLLSFCPFSQEEPAQIDRLMRLNTLVPMQLTRQVLPGMLAARNGQIVNIGSTFGSIGFAWFASYSASKFGLRGFSQALRRELSGSGVTVNYVAPRAVRTRLNTGAVYRMAEQVGMNMDEPAWVADQVVRAVQHARKETYLGFPESLFVRINAIWPGLVDLAVRRQGEQMKTFAQGEKA